MNFCSSSANRKGAIHECYFGLARVNNEMKQRRVTPPVQIFANFGAQSGPIIEKLLTGVDIVVCDFETASLESHVIMFAIQ